MSLMLFSCKEQHKASPFFEGYIEYSYQIYFYDTSRIVKEVFGKRGNKMICYVKNGNFLNEYFDTNNIGTERHLYNMDSNCFYNIVDREPVYKSYALIDATRE